MERQSLAVLLEGFNHQTGAQAGATDAHPHHIGEGFTIAGLQLTGEHIAAELL